MSSFLKSQIGAVDGDVASGLTATHTRLLQFATFTSTFDRFAIAPMLVAISHDLGASLGETAWAASGYFLLYGIMQPLWGIASDRLGRVRVMQVGLAGAALSGTISALVPTVVTLVLARALTGAFFAAVIPASLVYVGDSVPMDNRQSALTDMMAANALGTASGTAVAGFVASLLSWRLGFLLPAVVALVLVALLAQLPEYRCEFRPRNPFVQLVHIATMPWPRLILVLAAVEGGILLGILIYLAPALQASGNTTSIAGLVVAAYGLAVMAWSRVVKRLIPLLPAGLLMGLGGIMFIGGYAIVTHALTVGTVLVAAIVLGGGWAFMHSTLQTWATDVAPGARAAAVGLFVACVFGGGAIGTAIVAPLAGSHQFSRIFAFAMLASIPLTIVGTLGRSFYSLQEGT